MVIRRRQIEALGEHFVQKRAVQMADRIRVDFRNELATVNPQEFCRKVERLVANMRAHGFRQQPYLYRLISWGVFLGDDYLSTYADGSLLEIVSSNAPEDERFKKIVEVLTRNPDDRPMSHRIED